MAVTLLNSSSYVFGIASDETGIKAASFNVRVEPEFRVPRQGLQNAIEGWAIGPNQVTVSMEGEVNNTTGVMAATAIAAFTPGNSTFAFWGQSNLGTLFLTDAELRNERGSWKSASINFQSNAGVTSA